MPPNLLLSESMPLLYFLPPGLLISAMYSSSSSSSRVLTMSVDEPSLVSISNLLLLNSSLSPLYLYDI